MQQDDRAAWAAGRGTDVLDSGVRISSRQPPVRTPESKGHQQLHESSVVLDLTFLYEMAARMRNVKSPH
jgi:hypothetical protein